MRPPAGRYAQPSWVSTTWVLDRAAVVILALAGALHGESCLYLLLMSQPLKGPMLASHHDPTAAASID